MLSSVVGSRPSKADRELGFTLTDSEIILELGSSDGLPDKQQFNNGLREVVSSFQKSKMKDFRTIAQAIIDYRREYLGDDSKVLPLEGTSL